MNDLFWIGPALVFGLLATRFGLPPMVGYLIGGFILNMLGFVDHDDLSEIGELGVTLLLFTIGLKLDMRSLLRPVVWAGATLHMLAVAVLFKQALYFLVLMRFRMRARTSILASLGLANYSEFGLIVGAIALAKSGQSRRNKGYLLRRHPPQFRQPGHQPGRQSEEGGRFYGTPPGRIHSALCKDAGRVIERGLGRGGVSPECPQSHFWQS